MKRLLSIICIIFLIGITSAVPFYSTSYFVYAEGQTEQLSDDDILDAGLAVYLNARNGFITIADGTLNGAKLLMSNTIDSFITFYNANHSIQNQISKSSLVGNILVNYNPFRVSLKGSAVTFFNNLYDYLEDQGKVNNASNSNGGNTTDNLYDGSMIGSSLFYIYNSRDYTSFENADTLPADKLINEGTVVDHFSADYVYNTYNSLNPNVPLNTTGVSYTSQKNVVIHYSQNITWGNGGAEYRVRKLSSSTNTYFYNCSPCLYPAIYPSVEYNGAVLYSDRNYQVRGSAAWFIDRRYPNYYYYGFVSRDFTNNRYFFNSLGYYNMENSPDPITDVNINFETDNFQSAPTPPEGDDAIEYTPKDKTTNNTYNTYNEYITNYTIKNTYITNNNSGGGGSNDNPYPLDPENPSDPGGTTPDWSGNSDSGIITPDGNGGFTFNLPDFSLPDLNIDWSISGLSEKFPFSIPFDLLAFFTVLNAEPETPAIQATIPLGLWEWEIDWDLHNFDNLAELLRTLEFIGFCIGLALITRNIIKG